MKALRSAALVALAVATVWLVACSRELASPDVRSGSPASFAKAAPTGVTVTSVSPDSAPLVTTLDVHVYGGGFAYGAVAKWLLAGVEDSTQVRTNSTRFVSAKELVANITISNQATVAKWDVSVMLTGGHSGVGSESGVFSVVDPTTTWKFPLDDAGLSIKGDRLFTDGTNSLYAPGTCKLATTIWAGARESGDATLNALSSGGKCTRQFTFSYPDGFTQTSGSFNNLHNIANTKFFIPIGETVARALEFDPGLAAGNSSRCGGLYFGYLAKSGAGPGSDSVLVTRVDNSTWEVHSQAPPNDKAYCANNAQLYHMQVRFTIVSSRPLGG